MEKDNLAELKEALVNELGDDEYYAILAARSTRIQNRVSPILKALTFLGEPSARELQTAIDHFKSKDGVIDKAAPVDFLSQDEHRAITRGAKFRVSLYKALLFVHIQGAIKSGTLNLKHSYKYRPLDEYLIDRDRWHRDKAALIERAQLQTFVDPHRVLAELDEALSCQYGITNANIHEGKNPYIKFKNTGFTLSTPTQEESDAEPLQQFFPERHYLPLLEILATVNRYSHWMDELQHWRQRHRADVLVNNAGISSISRAEDTSAAQFRRVLEVNLVAPFILSRAFGSLMLAQGSGSIINIASIAGLMGIADRIAYNASKHGMIGLTRILAAEWGGRGVRCNAVCPAWVKTPMDTADQASSGYTDVDITDRVPMARFASPADIAAAVAFLADSEQSGFINGQAIAVDGGWTADGTWQSLRLKRRG